MHNLVYPTIIESKFKPDAYNIGFVQYGFLKSFEQHIFNQKREVREAVVFQIPILTQSLFPLAVIQAT